MAMIYHLIECLNQLGIKMDVDIFTLSDDDFDFSPLLDLVDLKKVMKNKNYLNALKNDLKNKYNEIKNEFANSRVDQLLSFIWEQAGVTVSVETLYPFRNAMINAFTYEATLVYVDVIDEFCDHLNKARITGSYVSKKYIKEEMWPALTVHCTIKNIANIFMNCCTVEHKLLMQTLSVIVKVGVDEKKKIAGKK